MRIQLQVPALAGCATLAIAAAMLSTGTALAAGAALRPPAGAALDRLARPAPGVRDLRTLLHVQSCAYVRSHRAELARRGTRFAACLQMGKAVRHMIARSPAMPRTPQRPVAGISRRPVMQPDAGVSDCSNQPSGQWLLVDRTDECLQQSGGYLVTDLNSGQIIAGATISLSQEFELSTTFWDWDELVEVSMTNPFGNQAALDVQVAWVSTCTSPCSPLDASAFTGDWADLSPVRRLTAA